MVGENEQMRKSIETNKILFVFLIICSFAFIIGIIYGIADFNRSETTYDELEYREYIFVSYKIDYNSEGGDKFYITVEGQDKTLCVGELLTPHKYDYFDALKAGDKIYCYVYEDSGTIQVAEIKADKMIISLDEYNDSHKKNGIGLIIVMSILSVTCAVCAIIIKNKMCLFKKRNSFEKNSKKYIENRFAFLIERGYECKYLNRGGEEEFIFVKGTAHIEVYSFNTPFSPFAFEIVISDNGFESDKRKNINAFIGVNVEDVKSFSPMETVDYYAEIVKSNIEKIEKAIL